MDDLKFYGLEGTEAGLILLTGVVIWLFFQCLRERSNIKGVLYGHIDQSRDRLKELELKLEHHAQTHERMEKLDQEAHRKLEQLMNDVSKEVAGLKEQVAEMIGGWARRERGDSTR